ncbi:unnamed protein product, partial [Pylaiella littoralis]
MSPTSSERLAHILWAKQYTGKEGFATIAYQAIVDHTGRLL